MWTFDDIEELLLIVFGLIWVYCGYIFNFFRVHIEILTDNMIVFVEFAF